MRFNHLLTRLAGLESGLGYVTLDDGTKFRPHGSGMHLMREQLKLQRDLGREPTLADFPADAQEQLLCYAKWIPDPGEHGAIAVLIATVAKGCIDENRFEIL
jgi:hypothetical protein